MARQLDSKDAHMTISVINILRRILECGMKMYGDKKASNLFAHALISNGGVTKLEKLEEETNNDLIYKACLSLLESFYELEIS